MYNKKATESLLNALSTHTIDTDAVRYFLKEGADPDAALVYKAGRYPALAQAIVKGNSMAVKSLISAGANIKTHLTVEKEKISMYQLAMKVRINGNASRGQKIMQLLDSANPA